MRDAFIYLSYKPHDTSKRIARVYNSLRKHVPHLDFHVVTFDAAAEQGRREETFDNIVLPHTIYNADSLGSLEYPNRPTKGNFSLTARGYVDLPIILFWLNNVDYSRFWVMEDDVEYTGDFGAFIKGIGKTNSNAGLACTHLRKLPDDWDYIYMFSSGTDILPPDMLKRVCFLPFFCITAAALSAIHSAYMRGWAGYNEMSWAMILDFAGIPIRDIGGNGPYVAPEDRDRHYIDRSPDDFRKLGSFGTLQIRLIPGRERNVLWHPIKTLPNWITMKRKRFLSIWAYYLARSASLFSRSR